MANRTARVPEPEPVSRGQRLVAVMFIAILVLSVAAILALIIGGPAKTGPIWASVALVPFIGLPLSVLLMISLVVLNAVRRGRAAKGVRK